MTRHGGEGFTDCLIASYACTKMPAKWQCSASTLTQELRGVAVAQRIAEFTARCEKYVGTESGGMDQAISIMGDKGLAKLVHFKPVRL